MIHNALSSLYTGTTMSDSLSNSLNPGVQKREVFGWAMYDFANSGYVTVVMTAVFASYFVGGIAKSATWATLAWTIALSISYALVMITMPIIGQWGDVYAIKKKLLMWTTAACVITTAMLSWVQPGDIFLALFLVVLSNLFFSYGETLAAAFLPELAQPQAMGKVSGWGWSLGYVGGMLSLGVSLAYVLNAQKNSIPASQFVPATMLITAGLYGVASLFCFALLKERAVAKEVNEDIDKPALNLKALMLTFNKARKYKDFLQLLACIVAYQAGVAVAITLAGIYAEQVIGFEPQETMVLIFVLNIAAMVGAFGLGYLQDKMGHKSTLALTLVGWILTCILAALTTSKGVFWIAAAVAGFCMGSSQSSGRAMVGILVPADQSAEFFGLWSFAVRLASILGPLMYGLITFLTDGNQRIAIASTGLLFVVGLLLLLPLNLDRGQELRRQESNASH